MALDTLATYYPGENPWSWSPICDKDGNPIDSTIPFPIKIIEDIADSVTKSVQGTVGSSTNVSIPAITAKTAILDFISVTGGPLPATVTSVQVAITDGTNTYHYWVSLGATLQQPEPFPIPDGIVASAQNAAITVTVPAILLVAVDILVKGHYV